MKQMPIVSVCMITYGHENYIEEAINGVLMQECNFEIELILANDCSADKTNEVILNILKKHPRASIINYIKHEKNIGMMPNFIFAMQHCKGKYIALCEGDDYWTDPLKLQKQVDFLDANEDYVLCFHPVKILKLDGEVVQDFITKVPENYETQESLARLGNYIHTPSVVFRNIIKEFPLEFGLSPIGDYFLYMLLTEHGKVKRLEDTMAVYRFGAGVFSSKSEKKIIDLTNKLFILFLSYSTNLKLNIIIIERVVKNSKHIEHLIRLEYADSFVSHNKFFKALKVVKKPRKFWKKLKAKFYVISY